MNREIKFLWSLQGDDVWGDCLSMFFAIAELLWAQDGPIPAEWKFRASPMHKKGAGAQAVMDRDDWPGSELAEMYLASQFSIKDLVHAGNVFSRYADIIKLAGRDY